MTKNLTIAILVMLVLFLAFRNEKPVETHPGMPKEELKQVAKDVKAKPEQIKTVIQYKTITRTQYVSVIDSNGKSQYKDQWTDIKTQIDSNSIRQDITIRDSILVVQFEKKTGFLGLGGKKTYIDIRNANPNVQVNEVKHWEIKTRPKNYSVGVGITYGWNGQKWQPTVGVSVTRTLFKF
jgi:hypothetical protein